MTESEARSKIKYRIEVARQIAGNGVDGKAFEDLEIAIQALKEIREYRELGTVKQIRIKQAEFGVLSKRYLSDLGELMKYQKIGTVEECRDNNDFLDFLYNHIPPNEMEQYLSMYHTKDKVAVNGYADQNGLMSAT